MSLPVRTWPNASRLPALSIGLPVYNGARFLAAALEAMLAQDFEDFELIVSDNASTDETPALCAAAAARDVRVRVVRQPFNLGPSRNFNAVVELARAPLFKWIAHDDLHALDFLSTCVAALRNEPAAVLAGSAACTIDAEGREIRRWSSPAGWQSPSAPERWRTALQAPQDPLPLLLFGVMRTDVLRRTAGFTGLPDCDRALLAELALHGRFLQSPRHLFLQREHVDRAGPRLSRDPHGAVAFWRAGSGLAPSLPHLALMRQLGRAVVRSPLAPGDRLACAREVLRWAGRQRPRLVDEAWRAAGSLPLLGPWAVARDKRRHQRAWARLQRRAAQTIGRRVPRGASLILVDDGMFGDAAFQQWQVRPMLERDGVFWGPPPDDRVAIRELERMRGAGARFIAFVEPALWWLTYYEGFTRHLDDHYPRLAVGPEVVVFALDATPHAPQTKVT